MRTITHPHGPEGRGTNSNCSKIRYSAGKVSIFLTEKRMFVQEKSIEKGVVQKWIKVIRKQLRDWARESVTSKHKDTPKGERGRKGSNRLLLIWVVGLIGKKMRKTWTENIFNITNDNNWRGLTPLFLRTIYLFKQINQTRRFLGEPSGVLLPDRYD